ncbi:MAG: leucine-rich repeat protein [Clostridia bacterium]|nr:leucine-rich repeat protein [Clostridia bacterium]
MKRKIWFIIVLALTFVGSLFLFACDGAADNGETDEKGYTVTFNTYGGTAVQNQSIEEGATATEPTGKVERAGYIFDGWDYDFTTPVTEDITVNAILKPVFTNTGSRIDGFTEDGLTVYDVVIPETLLDGTQITSVKASAFMGKLNIVFLTISDTVTTIGEHAFSSCVNLVKITLGRNVSTINNNAFGSMSKLSEIYNRSSLELHKGNYSEYGSIAYPVKNIYTDDEGESKLVVSAEGHITIAAKDSSDNDQVFYVGYLGGESEIVIPEDVTWVYYDACAYNTVITSVVIGDNVKTVSGRAFDQCTNLSVVTIGENVTSLGQYAFRDCTLTSATFKVATGWAVQSLSMEGKLSDPATAATWLHSYYAYNWTRS